MMQFSMDRRRFLKLSALASLAAGGVHLAAKAGNTTAEAGRPNFLILVFDALSARNMSLYGYPRETTPNLTRFAERAPALMLLLSKTAFKTHGLGQRLQGIPFQLIDIGIAGEHLVLRATELGLGTCWIGWFNTRRVRRFFRIPRKYKIAGLIALGYAEPRDHKERNKKAVEEIAFFNRCPD